MPLTPVDPFVFDHDIGMLALEQRMMNEDPAPEGKGAQGAGMNEHRRSIPDDPGRSTIVLKDKPELSETSYEQEENSGEVEENNNSTVVCFP